MCLCWVRDPLFHTVRGLANASSCASCVVAGGPFVQNMPKFDCIDEVTRAYRTAALCAEAARVQWLAPQIVARGHLQQDVQQRLFFHAGAGPVFNIMLPGHRQALRLSPAETRLTIYRRRLVCGGGGAANLSGR